MADDTIDLLKIKIEKAKRELPLETVNAINAVDWRAAILGLREKKGYTFEQLGDLELETELILCGLLNPADYPRELERRLRVSRSTANELVNEMNELVFKKIREELIKNTERKKIFAKKREEVSEYPEATTPTAEIKSDADILNKAGIEIVPALYAESIASAGRERKEVLPEIIKTKDILPVPQKIKITSSSTNKLPDSIDIVKAPEAPIKVLIAPIQTKAGTEIKEVNPLLAQKLSSSFQMGVVKTEHTLDNITKTNTPNPVIAKPKIPNTDPYRELPE